MANNIENIYELTPMQEGMLFHNLVDSNSTAYVVQFVFNINFKMRKEFLEKALELLADKYSVLRTFFVYNKVKKPYQIVAKKRKIESELIDYSDCDESKKIEELEKILKADIERGFDLQNDSLLRVKCIQLSSCNGKLIFTNHHIIMDGWCNTILYKTFFEFYKRIADGETVGSIKKSLEDGCDYGEFLKWISHQDNDIANDYFANLLVDYDNDCDIKPTRLPSSCDAQVKEKYIEIDSVTTKQLKKIAEECDSTINTVTEIAIGIMLQVYNGSKDVVFGKVVSGRNVDIPGIEKMIGLFINTIPVRVKVNASTTLKELLKEQQNQGIKSSNYEYCSLVDIQNQTLQGANLIKILYVFENYTSGINSKKSLWGDDKVSFEKVREQTNYGITISGYENDGKLGFKIMYDPSKYYEDEIQAILELLAGICEEISKDTSVKVCELDIVTSRDKRLWREYNATEEDIEKESLINLVHNQCQKTPDKIAIVDGIEQLTYAELWTKAEKIAGYLHAKGYGRNDFIAISGERSIWTVVNIIGIHAAGCAYVPENPEYPEERNQYMYNNSKCCDRLDKNSYKSENMEKYEPYCCESDPESLAYTIYTSGSTGVPKGVVIKHSAAANTVQDINKKFNVNENSCIIGLSAFSFDLSVYDVFGALSSGAKLVVVNDQRDAEEIQNIVSEHNVTFWNSVPAIMSMYLISGGKGNSSLTDVLLSGDWIPVTLPDQIRSEFSNAKVCSLGGATEGSIWSIYYPIENVPEGANSIPYGMPLANQKMLILNSAGKLCPIGAVGEICIAGSGVAEGYANQPEKTAAVFVNHSEYGRVYHTGDIGRMCPEGYIEFMGRVDEQVKIRGFRIELGEIESRLREIENIKDCAVIVKADASGDKGIYAYYTSDVEVSVSEIRDRLSESLPEYMVPAYIMQIAAIPVTRNGKVDKKSLPEIEGRAIREYIEPRNEIEEKICEIFKEILNVEQFGVKGNFFELGGHSLRATRLVNRIEAETGVKIALKDVFSHPTVEQLAVLAGGESEEYVPIPKAEEKEYYAMSSAQKRTYLIQQIQPETLTYNMSANLIFTGEVRSDELRAALQAMTDRHEILRTQFLMIDGEPVQKILDHVEADFEYVSSEESDEKLITEFLKPFDLSCGKLVRIKLVNKGEYHLMMFDMHHIVGDGMSMNTFTTELMALYNGEKLEPLTHQFK
ncbi:MAG: amino acid adenylation domain-containing protein, partial [Clostridia bacterium]|nr:amino acid adenylation domain-containing protein [Clostridia bacterium]